MQRANIIGPRPIVN
uniref:Uncharacterized protein n=1 Tax=Rhizophora mucronata TaxID=61149 RepID=A0A2P2MUZ5_RHIMU